MTISAYRHFQSRSKLRKYLLSVPAIGLVVAGALVYVNDHEFAARNPRPMTVSASAAPAVTAGGAAPATAPARSARLIYPHSVVAGGVHSKNELINVIKQDSVVAAHYAGINVAAARVTRVEHARAVHVSYRIGDKVYWTARKVMLAKGEALLTDGTSEMRTRCGNRISDVARLPVSNDEPSVELLDSALPPDSEGVYVPAPAGQSGTAGGGNPSALSLGGGFDSGTRAGAPTINLSSTGGFFNGIGSTAGTQPVSGAQDGPHSTAPLPTIVEINTPAGPDASNGSMSGTSGTTPAPDAPSHTDDTVPESGDRQDDVTRPDTAPPKTVDKELVSLLAPGTLLETTDQERLADQGSVPEPTSFWLIAAALAGMALLRRLVAARLHSSQPPSNTAI